MNFIIPYNTIKGKGDPINLDHIVSIQKEDYPMRVTNKHLIRFFPSVNGAYYKIHYNWFYDSDHARDQEYKRVISKIDPVEDY